MLIILNIYCAAAAGEMTSTTDVENRRSLRCHLPQSKVLELKNNQLTSEIKKRLENPNEGLEVSILIEINCTFYIPDIFFQNLNFLRPS